MAAVGAPAVAGAVAGGQQRTATERGGERAGDLVDRVLVDEVVEEGAEDAALKPHGDDLPRAPPARRQRRRGRGDHGGAPGTGPSPGLSEEYRPERLRTTDGSVFLLRERLV